ncbi:MAG: hypothetical protein ACSNEK_05050 [Parachlamydiaceae bacterium]
MTITISKNINSNIRTIEKLKIGKDTIAYTKGRFVKVGFWGRVIRVLKSLFLCDNHFKDCSPKFIARKMYVIYKSIPSGCHQKSTLRKKIIQYAQCYMLTDLLHKIRGVEKSLEKRDNTTSIALNQTNEESIDWNEMIKDVVEGNRDAQELYETLQRVGVSGLSIEQAIAIQAVAPSTWLIPWTGQQRKALQKHLFRQCTLESV